MLCDYSRVEYDNIKDKPEDNKTIKNAAPIKSADGFKEMLNRYKK